MKLLTTTWLCALTLLAGMPASAQAAATPAATAGGMRDITSLELSKQLSPGWNLGNTLEAVGSPTPPPWNGEQTNETLWGNPKASQALMDSVKAAGFKFVRIPVSWTQYADANHTISPRWMARVAEVVGYARNAGLYVMINVHWDGGWMDHLTYDRQAALNAKLAKFWTQIATHFKDHDDHLLFAGQNETHVPHAPEPPSAEALAVQNSFNQTFVNTVRATGGNNARRHLVVQTYNTNIGIGHDSFVMPADTVAQRLFVEVHFYDPYKMTLVPDSPVYQWGSASSQPEGAWATEARIDADFQKMKTRFIDKGVPVILGEYGAISKTEHDPSSAWRKKWAQFVTRSAYQRGLVPVWWDDGYISNHTFGLFDRKTGAQGHPEIIKIIVDAGT